MQSLKIPTKGLGQITLCCIPTVGRLFRALWGIGFKASTVLLITLVKQVFIDFDDYFPSVGTYACLSPEMNKKIKILWV